MTLRLLLILLLWTAALPAAPGEKAQVSRWRGEIQVYAATQPPEVRQALQLILDDALQLARLSPHRAYDSLQSTMAKIESARRQPQGAVQRERLDSPVGNFGEVTPGKLYRGAQPSARGLRWLRDQGVQTIVLLREAGVEETNYPDYSRADYIRDIQELGMQCLELTIRDHTVPTPAQIEDFLRATEQATCFVHCSAGIGRTGVMAGLYLRLHGSSPRAALEECQRFQLNPAQHSDHALQASFIANYPLSGLNSAPLDVGWKGGVANPLVEALSQGRGWTLGRAATLALDTERPAPTLESLSRLLRDGRFVRLRFRTSREIDVLASLARALPPGQKMGSVQLKELSFGDRPGDLDLAELRRARHLLGEAPFEARASGLTAASLTPQRLDELVSRLDGQAQVIDLNLPNGENPSLDVMRYLWKRGLACALHQPPEGAPGIGYLGLQD